MLLYFFSWITLCQSVLQKKKLDLPHHRGHIPHKLIIPKPDHASTGSAQAPQPQRGQRLFPPGVFVLLQIMNISIHFNHQRGLVTIEIDNESLNNLLPPKADSQLLCPPKVPEGGNSSHKIFSAGVMSRRSSLAR